MNVCADQTRWMGSVKCLDVDAVDSAAWNLGLVALADKYFAVGKFGETTQAQAAAKEQ